MPISPNQGSNSGGTFVTITGVNLANAQKVLFGENLATITTNTPTMVSVISPAGCGVSPVQVVTLGGNSNQLPFYYIPNPSLISLSEESGPTSGGNTITLSGTNLSSATQVNFGPNSATPTIVNDSTITVVAPANSPGQVRVQIISAGGVTASLYYTYVDAPTIVSLSPTSGPSNGGTVVTLSGTDLAYTTSVSIDGNVAPFTVINNTLLSFVTPVGTPGAVDVVTTTSGGSATAVGAFTYISGPGI